MPDTLRRNVHRLGLFCITVVGVALAAAIPLDCGAVALRVGAASLSAGVALGAALALVTRSRRPWLIYLGLALGALTFVPLYREWPAGDGWDIHPWRGAPPLVYGYLDGLRTLLYLVGIPWPFARFGFHAPDPFPVAEPTTPVSQDESEKP